MSSLSQADAAWLLSCSPRRLRDRPDCPRNADGSYSGQAIVRWDRATVETPELTDDEVETLKLVYELGIEASLGSSIIGVMQTLNRFVDRHGERGLVAVAKLFFELFQNHEQIYRWLQQEPTASELALQAEQRRRLAAEDLARAELRIAHVCEKCQRVRRGRQWVASEPPAGFVAVGDLCPRCDRNRD